MNDILGLIAGLFAGKRKSADVGMKLSFFAKYGQFSTGQML